MSWKNLQEWAQRVWAKHYQQSPIGSTQNVKPVIVQGQLGTEYISSAPESSPADQNASTNEAESNFGYRAESNFGYRDNLQPTNQQTSAISQNVVPAKPSEVLNVAAQLANRSSLLPNQNEVMNIAAGRGSGYVCCHGDAVNKLNVRNQLDVQSPIERDLAAAARHRERLAMQSRLEQTVKNGRKSRCTFRHSLFHLLLLCNTQYSKGSLSSMLEFLGWKPLEEHRLHSKLSLMYKIDQGIAAIPATVYLQPVTGYITRGHNRKFVVPQSRINAYRHSFFPSTIMLWNSLPTSVVYVIIIISHFPNLLGSNSFVAYSYQLFKFSIIIYTCTRSVLSSFYALFIHVVLVYIAFSCF